MIRLERVIKRYRGRVALDGVSLEVSGGEVIGLIGPNGAGKSTALKVVAGIVRPDAGRVLVGGHDVTRERGAAQARLGYVPQRLAFPEHVTCADVCRVVAALRDDEGRSAADALAAVGLADRGHAKVRELSGGQRQRLSLALALIGSPAALVLDEPSISLDADGAEAVGRAVASARARGAAILLATHHLHEVALLADRVVVLHDGRVVAEADGASVRDARAFEAFYGQALAQARTRAA